MLSVLGPANTDLPLKEEVLETCRDNLSLWGATAIPTLLEGKICEQHERTKEENVPNKPRVYINRIQ